MVGTRGGVRALKRGWPRMEEKLGDSVEGAEEEEEE